MTTNKMSKAELRSQLLNDTLKFVLAGNQIQEIPSKNTRIKVVCRGSSNSNSYMTSSEPSFNISSIYNREV